MVLRLTRASLLRASRKWYWNLEDAKVYLKEFATDPDHAVNLLVKTPKKTNKPELKASKELARNMMKPQAISSRITKNETPSARKTKTQHTLPSQQ